MPHTIREKTELLNRVRRTRGQIEVAERALEDEKSCVEVLQIMVGARGAISSLRLLNAVPPRAGALRNCSKFRPISDSA